MAELSFDVVDVQPMRYSAAPTLTFKLRIAEVSGQSIHAMALRVQIRIEPQRRRYGPEEAELLTHLFGDPSRWGDTLRPFQFSSVAVMVKSFTGSIEVDVEVPVSYDLEVAAGKYFHALQNGVVPMVLLFSGTIFGKGDKGFWVEPVPWHVEAECRMPIEVWDQLIALHFPQATWIKLHKETLDALLKFKAAHAIPTWDEAMTKLLAAVKS
ncbi:DUF6084 family protein [Amycolatopsis sp. NPDC059657]|uniref:DUF6084 family protein n=1 Tax=Amycolatopsis sp. NPDC059657 TaxID=3346899 RepID=UPI0036706D72